MVLDKIRGQAKHAAWYDDPDDPPNFNPFRKVRTGLSPRQNSLHNAENGDGELLRINTDQEHQHADVLSRKAEMGGAAATQQRYPTAPIPDRPCTMPIREEAGPPFEIPRVSSPRPEQPSAERELLPPTEETKDSTSGDTVIAQDTTTGEKPRQRKGLKGMFHREKNVAEKDKAEEGESVKPHYTFGNQIRASLFNSWINVLLLAGKRAKATRSTGSLLTYLVPVGIIVNYIHVTPVAIFIINFIAIIPLAALLSYATEEIALRTGEVIGGLLNASFG
jgi:Ca2+:H+ antiporter